MKPFGLNGHVKLSDLFIDHKIPRAVRRRWPILMHGDEIAWVVGLRRGHLAPVSTQTKRVLTVQIEGALPWTP